MFSSKPPGFRSPSGCVCSDSDRASVCIPHDETVHRAQGLPDHAHKPTLEQLPRDMHVVANDAAAKVRCWASTAQQPANAEP